MEPRRSRLFFAIVVAGASLGTGCRTRPWVPPGPDGPVVLTDGGTDLTRVTDGGADLADFDLGCFPCIL